MRFQNGNASNTPFGGEGRQSTLLQVLHGLGRKIRGRVVYLYSLTQS